MKLNNFVKQHYNGVVNSSVVIRLLLAVPILLLCLIYGSYLTPPLNPPEVIFIDWYKIGVHPWKIVLVTGAFLYYLSLIFDLFVVLSPSKTVKYRLGRVTRLFRVVTYLYVGATISNFTWSSYVSTGFSSVLHPTLIVTMILIIFLIFLHAYQCKEGLRFGGSYSEKTT